MIKEPISHVLSRIGKLKGQKQIEALQESGSRPMINLLAYCYNPEIVFKLPEGETPRKTLTDGSNEEPGLLYGELRRMYLFVDGPGGKTVLSPRKLETLWIELLEYIHPDDAKMLDMIKDKKLPGITAATVLKAFPGLF